jgi:hypothetical protein
LDNNLAPTYEKLYGECWVLWFSKSNSYSIVESSFKELLDHYLQSKCLESFKAKLNGNGSNLEQLAETFNNYLIEANRESNSYNLENYTLNKAKRKILRQYSINEKTIQVYYDSELVLKTVHPAIAHHLQESNNRVKTTFDIYLENEYLYLFKNEKIVTRVPKRDYHLLQGKFIIHLLCTIHNKTESDWLGTFHGSTITDGKSSILFIGESGKGKSTLCALLTANSFNLLADDVSPMLSKNKSIYYNPSAISIKEGAFKILQPIIKNFDNLPIVQFNKAKGPLKYIPCSNPETNNYPCNIIILVNYQNQSKTLLEKIPIKTILEILIPDSWLSPNPINAKHFLDWIDGIQAYKLTYSDTKSVINEVTNLFKQHNKSL